MKHFPVQAPRQILVTCPQRLGDVLLSTALIHSLKQAWPQAAIDVLVFKGTEGVLAGNPDIRHVHSQAARASLWDKLRELSRLWRRYDLAIAAMPTDRSRLYAWAGGRFRIGFLTGQANEKQKAWWLDRHVLFDDLDTHTVAMQGQLLELLGMPSLGHVIPPALTAEELARFKPELSSAPYVVLHPCPKFRYKMWPQLAWVELATQLRELGYEIVFSGGYDADEQAYVSAIAAQLQFPSRNFSGRLSFAHSATLLESAALYVGPDTVMTHLAAACGTRTIALFGPSNPVKWGPWPVRWASKLSPWQRIGSACQGNVYLVQGEADCVPCMEEGCDRHVNSPSACLDRLPSTRIMSAAKVLLGLRP